MKLKKNGEAKLGMNIYIYRERRRGENREGKIQYQKGFSGK